MKYVPVEVEENFNVSQGSSWWYGLRIFMQVVLVGLLIYMLLGLFVDVFVPLIPIKWEDKIAQPIVSEMMGTTNSSAKYDQAKIQELVNSLSQHMTTKNKRRFTVSIVDSKESNALALPGSHIMIYSGLLDNVKSENELAMIMSHELGHFAHRDHLRGLGRSFLFYLVTLAVFGGDSPTAKIFMNSSGIARNTYSRSQEYAADMYALKMLNKHYGHVGGCTDFFKRLAKKETLPQLTQYLSTHPASMKRVAALENAITEQNLKVNPIKPVTWLKAEQSTK